MRRFYLFITVFIFLLTATYSAEKHPTIKLATTTSTENSGLLAYLLPSFTKKTGITVHVIAVGSGKAIMHGKNGDVDVLLLHSPKAEAQFIAEGLGVDRHDVMYNDFVIVGPPSDPTEIKSEKTAVSAFKKLAQMRIPFVSRGDESGTHAKEKKLWKQSGITPQGKWYIQAGQGMEAVIMMSNEKQGYTLTDRGTFIAVEDKVQLVILSEGDSNLFNQYGVIAVNPEKHKHVKYKNAKKFISWITGTPCQKQIARFKKNGKQLFFPNAKKAR
jgi:tungstate transport system substrate-binding protein